MTTQLLVTLLTAAIAWAYGREAAYSVFWGGMTCLIPNLYFARRVFGRATDGTPQRVFGAMVRAEVAKLVLAGLMFVAAFVSMRDLNVPALFIGYVSVQIGGTLAVFLSGAGSGHHEKAK